MQETNCITLHKPKDRGKLKRKRASRVSGKCLFRLSRVAVQLAGVNDDMGIRMFASSPISRCFRASIHLFNAAEDAVHSPDDPDTLDTGRFGISATQCVAVSDTTWHARRSSSWHGTFHILRKVGRRLLFGGSLYLPSPM